MPCARPEVVSSLRGLGVAFPGVEGVREVSLELRRGAVTALVGESGSGKSQLGLAITGLTGGRVTVEVRLGARSSRGLSVGALRQVRGRRVA